MSSTEDESFPIDDMTFQRYRRSSTKEKLRWLEEINDFVNETSTEKSQKMREKFLDGDL